MRVSVNGYVALGYQQLNAISAATSLTVPSGAEVAYIAVSAAVRYRDDGTAPTASTGVTIPTAVAPFLYNGDLTKVQFIPVTGSATVDVLYYGVK